MGARRDRRRRRRALGWCKEIRRVNEELDRVKAQPAMDAAARQSLPTLRRDPATGEWRVN